MMKVTWLVVAAAAATAGLGACSSGDAQSGPAVADEEGAGTARAALPDACTIMRAADLAAAFPGTVPPVSEVPAVSNADVAVSHCTAFRDEGAVSLGLLVRQRLTDTNAASSAEQAKDMVADTQPGGMLEGMKLEEVAGLGEAALWSPASGQVNVFYRGGRAYVIVTAMNTPDNKAAALSLARQVVAKYP